MGKKYVPNNIIDCLLSGLARHYDPSAADGGAGIGACAGLIAGVDCDHRLQVRALDTLCEHGLAFRLASGRYAITNVGMKILRERQSQ